MGLLVAVSLIAPRFYNRADLNKQLLEIEKLKKGNAEIRKLDSIRGVEFKLVIDSLWSQQKNLLEELEVRSKKEKILFKNVYELKDKFDRIALPDRPDF